MTTNADSNVADRVALATRVVNVAEALLSLGAAAILLIWPKDHGDLFAFAVVPAMTASFMGANFAGGSAMKWFSLAERSWLSVRQSVIGVGIYVAAIGVATLANLDSFNLARPAAMTWVSVYVLLPFILVGIVLWQRRVAATGHGNATRGPTLPRWLRTAIVVTAALFVIGAIGLVFLPGSVEPFWPWALKSGDGWGGSASSDPSGGMGGYVAGWLLGLAVTLAHAAWENDARRSRVVFIGGLVAGLINIVSCVRFADDLRWSGPAWFYLAMLVVLVIASAIGLRVGATPRASPAEN